MRKLSALVAALSLGACAAQPSTHSDLATQIRSDFGGGKQSCEDRSPGPGQNAAHVKCFTGNPVSQLKPSVQTAEARTRTKQRIVIDQPGRAAQPKLASANETVVESIPTLNSEANCHLPDNLAVTENANHCQLVESGARDELTHRWIEFPGADRSHCTRYTTAGGGGTYTGLLTCLEMELHVRNLPVKDRSAANQ
jgi:hypothetical protein